MTGSTSRTTRSSPGLAARLARHAYARTDEPAVADGPLAELSGSRTWTADDELQVFWPAESGAQQLVAEANPDTPTIDAIMLPLDEAVETRLDAARQFWRALNGRPSKPSYGALPLQTRLRHILNLRAHDARRACATQRQTAETLLSSEPIVPRDWRDHHLRHKVRAILRRADRMIAGGYRDFLFCPTTAVASYSAEVPSTLVRKKRTRRCLPSVRFAPFRNPPGLQGGKSLEVENHALRYGWSSLSKAISTAWSHPPA